MPMAFSKQKAAIAGAVLSAVMGAALFSNSFTYAFSGNYKSWKQYGSSWSSMYLGESADTVADSGCAVTAAAILMVQSGSVTDNSFNPGVIVEYLNQHKGFSSSGMLNWAVLTDYAPDFRYISNNAIHGKTQLEKAQEIQNYLDEGYYVIVRIKHGDNIHFVAVDSVQGENVTMMDPGSKSTSLFERYSVDYVDQARLFKGKNSPADAVVEEDEEILISTEIDAPETSPIMPETLAPETEFQPETAPPEIIPETTTTAPPETTETTTTTTTTTTPPLETQPPSETVTETTVPLETAPPETEFQPETAPDPLIEEALEDDSPNMIEFVILQDAPEIAPEIAGISPEISPVITGANPDAETTVISIPQEQAQAKLVEIGQQHILMSIRFTLKSDVLLCQDADATAILDTIPAGTSLNVVEVDDAFQWGKVSFNGKDGWIPLNFAEL